MPNLEHPETGHNEPDRPIGTVRKNARESVVVALRTFKGFPFIDVRLHALNPDGSTVPTAKGVTLKAGALPELISLLRRAHAAAVEAGWCNGDGR
jgi:hypothetical protein